MKKTVRIEGGFVFSSGIAGCERPRRRLVFERRGKRGEAQCPNPPLDGAQDKGRGEDLKVEGKVAPGTLGREVTRGQGAEDQDGCRDPQGLREGEVTPSQVV